MPVKRTHHTYRFKKGGKTIHSGITKDPKRREKEHKLRFRGGNLQTVGKKKTETAARKWESRKPTAITRRRKTTQNLRRKSR